MAGIPISVVRSYDSRDKGLGDFGIGWRLDVNSLRLRVVGVHGSGWQQVQSGGVLNRRYTLVPTRTHKVAITLPGGKVEEFDMAVSPSSQAFVPIQVVDASYTARAQTLGTLRALGETRLITQGVVGALELLTESSFEIFDPQQFEYTTADGQVITLSRSQGVTQIRDRNGNTVTFGSDGITHSAGKSIVFTRDAQGRITTVTDPLGNVQRYAYDANGDLTSHTDALGQRTHLPLQLRPRPDRDPRPARRAADPQRVRRCRQLVSTTDANGKDHRLHPRPGCQPRDGHRPARATPRSTSTTTKATSPGRPTRWAASPTAATTPRQHLVRDRPAGPHAQLHLRRPGQPPDRDRPAGKVTTYTYNGTPGADGHRCAGPRHHQRLRQRRAT
jgi:YD repeat-containing protein